MWLSLADYSMKHKVSVSTLRRKIKSTEIQFRLDDGKYFLLDEEPTEAHRPSLKSETSSEVSSNSIQSNYRANEPVAPSQSANESVITAANRLLADLKKAYTQVLQDKENQIMSLKEEISDLKTLIKVLESENDRLRDQNQ